MAYAMRDQQDPPRINVGTEGKDEIRYENHKSSTGIKHLKARLGSIATKELHMPLCVTCGTQTSYKGADLDISSQDTEYKCPICLDPRQFIGSLGQRWTTLQDLLQNNSLSPSPNVFTSIIPDSLWTFQTLPKVGIGQRAFLIKDSKIQGLIMWDCIAYLDDETLNWIDEFSKGQGVSHMIVSHPHYYTTTATWTAAFPKMKLWLAKEDFNDWYQRIDIKEQLQKGDFESESVASRIHLVDEEQTSIDPHGHVKILLLGGHFPGSLVLLWNEILFIADTIQVVPSALYKSEQKQRPGVASVTFLWSYPNQIPLSGAEITRVCAPLEKVSFSMAFGAFPGFDILGHAKEKILQSRDIFLRRLATE